MTTILSTFYRPPENHVGIIYRFGRFERFANPDQWSILIPWIDSVEKETSLDMRTTHIQLKHVHTQDNIAVDLELKIFYFVDLRQVSPAHLSQVLRFPAENEWDEIVRTEITDLTRNQIVIFPSFTELTTPQSRSHLKHLLSSSLAESVRGFGILVNPKFGVNIIGLQPNETVPDALKEEFIAKTIGTAAVNRLQPLFEHFSDKDQEKSLYALIMQIASAVAKNGQSPDIIFPDATDYLDRLAGDPSTDAPPPPPKKQPGVA